MVKNTLKQDIVHDSYNVCPENPLKIEYYTETMSDPLCHDLNNRSYPKLSQIESNILVKVIKDHFTQTLICPQSMHKQQFL